jgi:hypothetical protein
VTGDAWRVTPQGRVLELEPVLEPAGERQQVQVAGFGLLDETGGQVGWCQMPSPIAIDRGQRMLIPRGSIRF